MTKPTTLGSMAVPSEDIAKVREATDLVELVTQHVALRRVGSRWSGLCPFHSENTPSFSVNSAEGLYYCFGCHAKGDVISFVQETQGMDFLDALRWLADRAHIPLHVSHDRPDPKKRDALRTAMKDAVAWYHERLLNSPDAGGARAYLRDRGYDGEVVREFQLGWAPDDWDALSKALKLSGEVLTDTGLGFVNRRGRTQDSFRARVLFPIFGVDGSPVAFGGRILPGADGPKYKNSSETPLYVKSKTLYGLHWAKEEISAKDEVVVCEGYTDVIGCFSAGIRRAVATCGTALTDDHVRTLKHFANRVVLAYDADSAGAKGAERMYQWEKELGFEVVVADLPAGMDPGELAGRDPEALRKAIEKAKPFLQFRLERLYAAGNFRTIEGRARVAESAMELVNAHPNPMVRDQYVLEVSTRTRVPVDVLTRSSAGSGPAARLTPGRPGRPGRQASVRREPKRFRAETEALRMAVLAPEYVAEFLSEVAADATPDQIERWLFRDPVAQRAFGALLSSDSLREAIEIAEDASSDLLAQLAMDTDEAVDAAAAVSPYYRLVERLLSEESLSLESDLRIQPERFADIVALREWMALRAEELREGATAKEAAAQVVGWLVQRS